MKEGMWNQDGLELRVMAKDMDKMGLWMMIRVRV